MTKNLTQGNPMKVILLFSLPVLLGNIFQQLYGMVDSIIVGQYVGTGALGAVGASFPINFLVISVSMGLTTGCSIIVSQYFGSGDHEKMRKAIFTSLGFLSVVSIALSVVAYLCTPLFLRLLRTPGDIFADAVVYLRITFAGLFFTVLYNACAAIFRALGDSKTPLYFLIIASVLNVGGDLFLVINMNMGVAGVALATIASQGFCAAISLAYMLKKMPELHHFEKKHMFEKAMVKNVMKYGLPSSTQQVMVCLRMLLIQGLVNSYGSVVTAGFTSANRIETFALMPMLNIGMAFSMYVGQNMGMGNVQRVKDGLRASIKLTVGVCVAVSALIYLFCPWLLGLFLNSEAPAGVMEFGIGYLKCVALFYWISSISLVIGGVLRGSGDMNMSMTAAAASTIVRVVSAYALAPHIGYAAIWWSNPIAWVVELAIVAWRYKGGQWMNKTVTKTPEKALAEE